MERHLWPRPNQAHLARQHIKKLWQLINAELPDKAPEFCFARVVFGAPARILRAGDPHTAELPHLKNLFTLAHPFLLEQNGARAAQLHPNRRTQHDRAGHHDQKQRSNYVHPPLCHRPAQVVQRGGTHIHKPGPPHHIDRGVAGKIVVVKRDNADAYPLFIRRRQYRSHIPDLLGVQRHDQLVRVAVFQNLFQFFIVSQAFPKPRPRLPAHIAVHCKAHLRVRLNVL